MGSHDAGLRLISEVLPLAQELIGLLGNAVIDMAIAGSIRRNPRWGLCHDIDLVFRPVQMRLGEDFGYPVWDRIMEACDKEPPQWVVKREAGYKRSGQRFPCINRYPVGRYSQPAKVAGFFRGVQVDFYPSYTTRDYWSLLVVRTGPFREPRTYGEDDPGAKQNMALAQRAWRYGLRMQMAGGGLYVKDPTQWHGGALKELLEDKGADDYLEDLPATVREGQQVGWQSEQHFFAALKLPYVEPHDRDDPAWDGIIHSKREFELGENWPELLSLE